MKKRPARPSPGRPARSDRAHDVFVTDVVVMGAVAVMLLALPFVASREVLDTFDLPKQSAGTVLAAFATGAWLCRPLERRRLGVLSSTWQGVAAAVFLGMSIVSILRCVNVALGAWELGRMIVFIGTMAAVCDVVDRPSRARVLIGCALLAGLGVSYLGLTQVYGSEYPLYPQVAKPAASFGNKNMACEYLVTVFPAPMVILLLWPEIPAIAAPSVVGESLWSMSYEWVEVPCLLLIAMMATFLIAGWTRTDYVAAFSEIAIVAGLCMWVRRRVAVRRLMWLGAALAVAVVVSQIPRVFASRFPEALRPNIGDTLQATFSPTSGSLWWRFTAWANTGKMVLDRPFLGCGINNWQLEYPLYHRAVWSDPSFDTRTQATTLHDDYLQVWAESGAVAVAGFVVLVASVVWMAIPLALRGGAWSMPGVAASLGCLGFAVDAMGSFPLKLTCPALQFFILAGVAIAAWRKSGLHAHPPESGAGAGAGAGAGETAMDASRQVLHAPAQTAGEQGPAAVPAVFEGWIRAWNRMIERASFLVPHPRIPGQAFCVLSLGAALIGLTMISSRAVDDLRSNNAMKEAMVQQARNQWCKAVESYAEAVRLQPFVYSQYLLMGRALFNCGLLPLSAEANGMAAVYHPNHCNVYFNWGNCLREMGDVQGALEKFSRCVALYPDNADGLNSLGISQREMGKLEDAEKSFRHAVEARPGFVDALLNEGLVLGALGRMDEARAVYQSVLEANPTNARAWVRLGDLAGSQNRLDDAVKYYSKALDLQPAYLEALNNLGGTYWRMGNAERARYFFRRALSFDPNFGPPYFGLADIEYRLHNDTAAIDLYQQFLAHWNTNDTYSKIARERIGQLQKKKH